jgi:hypothetical protein
MAKNKHDERDWREHFRERADRFSRRFQEEAKGVESRVKDGIASALEESRHPETRFGRPPRRPPPSGRPPSGRR